MSLLTSWLASPLPDAAIEIAPDRVSAATLAVGGGSPRLQNRGAEALPADAIAPSLNVHNILDKEAVVGAVRAVLGRLGTRVARAAVVIPDLAGKVSVVRFERVPPRRDDLDQLVRWQIRKALPFPVEDACVTYTVGRRGPEGTEFIVVAARRQVVSEYEEVCAAAGVHAGLVELATFSVLNLTLATTGAAGTAGDWLVVHMRPEYTSVAIVRDGDLIFFRNRPEGDEGSLPDVVHQTAMYYQDRLEGQGFRRVLLGGSGGGAGAFEAARQNLEERLGTTVEPIDPAEAPLAGVLLRARHEAMGV